LADAQGSFWRRHRWLMWTSGVLVALLIAAGVAVSAALHHAEPYLRARVIAELEQRFHARVELDGFHVSLLNGLQAEGKGLRIWPPGQPAGTGSGVPLIQLDEFRFHAPLRYTPGKPIYISEVRLNGLDVVVPPRLRHAAAHMDSSGGGTGLVRFKVGRIDCSNARLTLETNKPDKAPLVFVIAQLKLTDVNEGVSAMGYEAQLTNPRPKGTIYTHGNFGPWDVDDPGGSPITGNYRFEHADLGTFRGIAGILSSTGKYDGTLRDMTVDGETDTPDFRLDSGGNGLHLRTQFHARVDATNGDTWLEPVDATLGQSHFTARGKIVHEAAQSAQNGQSAHPGGHDIALKVNVDRGHMEDFLRLATQGEPLLTGDLKMQTSLEVPPGKAPISDRLLLNGQFLLDNAEFTDQKMQNRVEELSMRGQGKPKEAKKGTAPEVHSTMQSDFEMANGVITLSNLKYMVPGAEIDLKGTYGIDGGSLNFTGRAKMQATISRMVGGWKGVLLTPLDHFFEHGKSGTVFPVEIKGTRKDPQFGVDFGGLKKTSPQTPGGSSGAS
jgi:AsmA-like C-terminal region